MMRPALGKRTGLSISIFFAIAKKYFHFNPSPAPRLAVVDYWLTV
jgi:hypothetical protein